MTDAQVFRHLLIVKDAGKAHQQQKYVVVLGQDTPERLEQIVCALVGGEEAEIDDDFGAGGYAQLRAEARPGPRGRSRLPGGRSTC